MQSVMEQNPVGLTAESVEAILPDLDRHVASLFVLFHQYQKHHWLVEGPTFRDLHLYLEEAYTQVHQNVDALAERMTVLGGIPAASPTALAELAYVTHEAEGMRPVREMLRADLEMEQAIITALRRSVRTATDLGDYGTEHLLKTVLAAAEERAHHLDHYLQESTLVAGG